MQTKILKKKFVSALAVLALVASIVLPMAPIASAQVAPMPVPVITITPAGPFNVSAGSAVTFTATATDPNATGNISYSISPSPNASVDFTTNAVMDSLTGVFTWTPTTIGTETFDVLADDGVAVDAAGNPITGILSVTINVATPAPLVVNPIAAQSVVLGSTDTFTTVATGGTAPYTYAIDTATPIPATATFDTTTGAFSWVTDAVGAVTFNIIVTDSSAATATVPVTINVSAVPTTPTLTTITINPATPFSIHMGTTQLFTAIGFDQIGVSIATQPAFVWASSDTTVGTINANGMFTALTTGTTTVTATSGTVTPGTTVVNVTPALLVTFISPIQTSASPNNDYASGWKWVFYVTIPANETILSMKFDNWTNGSNTIPTANNMQFFSAQSSSNKTETSAVQITAANTYSAVMNIDPALGINPLTPDSRQIEITVEAKIPTGSAGGSYSTNYGVNTVAPAAAQ